MPKTPIQKMMPPRVGEIGMRIVPTTNPPYPMRKLSTVVRSRPCSRGTSLLAMAYNPSLRHAPRIQDPLQLLLGKDLVL